MRSRTNTPLPCRENLYALLKQALRNALRHSGAREVRLDAVLRGPRLEVTVRDESSHVRRAEYSVDGGRWQEVHPRDGISDALEERYEIPLGPLEGPSPHVVVVRATDLLGNVATGRVEIP